MLKYSVIGDWIITKEINISCYPYGHTVVENGAKRSWCKHCNIDMVFDWNVGKYTAVGKMVEEDKKPSGVEL